MDYTYITIHAFTIINSEYDLNNNNISTIFTQHPYCCVNNIGRLWPVCEVVGVTYVDAVVAVTVMRMCCMCVLKECDGVRLTVMLV